MQSITRFLTAKQFIPHFSKCSLPARRYAINVEVTDEDTKQVDIWSKRKELHSVIETDYISPTPAQLLAITLGRRSLWPNVPIFGAEGSHKPAPPATIDSASETGAAHPITATLPPNGTPLPPGYHLVYFPPRLMENQLSSDGFDREWSPPAPFSTRMWAGAKIKWNENNPLRIGDTATTTTTLKDVDFKKGGQRGDKLFVVIEKKVENAKGLCLTEERRMVYLKPDRNEPEQKYAEDKFVPEHNATFENTVTPSSLTLFRYSALTFNSHLIHYNQSFVESENFPDLVVHGPLTLTYMLDALQHNLSDDHQYGTSVSMTEFDYRVVAPLFADKQLTVRGHYNDEKLSHGFSNVELWCVNQDNRISVTGTGRIAKVNW